MAIAKSIVNALETVRKNRCGRRLSSSLRGLASLLVVTLFASSGFAQVVVTGSTGANGPYTSLTQAGGAFDAINLAGSQAGNNILITIIADSTAENGATSLNASDWTTLTVNPVGGRTVSGTVAGPMISLNGADNVNINGLNVLGDSLTISNDSATATASTIRFINDASNNTVTNCLILGSSTAITTGTVLFSTGTTTGNVSNTISNNSLTSAGANLPANAIFSLGTSAAIFNSGTISGNNISDYFSATLVTAGINLAATGNSAWTISNNKLFQTATRLYTTGNTHSAIFVGVGSGYTINGNIIGFANSAGTGTTNMIGNSVALAGFPGSYATAGTATLTGFRGINAAFTAGGAVSNIQGNVIAGHALYTSANGSAFIAILVASGNVNVGTTTKNIIGSESGAGGIGTPASIYSATTGTGGSVVGILVASTNTATIQNNTIGSIDAVGTSATIAGTFVGITTQGALGVMTVSNNTVGNSTLNNIRIGYTTTTGVAGGPLTNAGIHTATSTASTGVINGIANSATGAPLNLTSNIIRNLASSVTNTTAGTNSFLGVFNSGAVPGTINITNNQLGTATERLLNWIVSSTASTNFAIVNAGGVAGTTVNINNNIIQGFVVQAPGSMNMINNQGAAGVAINIKDNQIGTATQDAITYAAASAAQITCYQNQAGTAAALLTMTGNDIRRIVQTVAGGGSHSYYINTTFTGSTNISDNTITNVTANTTGTSALTMIGNSVSHAASTTHNVNNNRVVGTYTKTGGSGAILYYNAFGSSGNTVTETNNLNNFSNMNFTGTTGANAGWRSADGTTPGSRKSITNNTFSNITGGTGAMTSQLYVGFSDQTFASNNISGNVLSNITNGNSITGILSDGQNQNFFNNTITGLSGTAASAVVIGIQITGSTTQNIFKNQICDLTATGATATTNGILVSSNAGAAPQTVNIYNNLIGILKAPSTSSATDAVRGINLTSTTTLSNLNVDYNTIYLNASGGANFSTSGIFHTASATATTATLTLRNNIIDNVSIPSGTGVTVALRRSAATLANFATTSNNNDFYADTPGPANLIYHDSVTPLSTLAAYKSAVTPRDSASITEAPPFVSTSCSADIGFLHINPLIATQIEGGGTPIGGIADDFDGNPRNAVTPDIGADELNGTPLNQGACCWAQGCTQLTQLACQGQPGFVSWSFNTLCVDANCPPVGRCCSPTGSCTLVTQSFCQATPGSSWNGVLDCTSACQTGACCLPNKSCVTRTQAGCLALNGCYQGDNSTCSTTSAFAQNFDGVVVPALPAGWVATNAVGPTPLWVTSNSGTPTPVADTAPNAAFVNDPAVVSDKQLDSPSIFIASSVSVLTFRHNFILENGFDGGVFEISIGGGPFNDILSAGGSFTGGGYNGTISSDIANQSPIVGRTAWTGTSSGFITTTVSLPASARGQFVVLRWRMGSDNTVAGTGWRVDTVSLSQTVCLNATANAGGPYNTCQTASVLLSGSATNFSSVSWATSGTGTFTNGNTLSATYNPSLADTTSGPITLTLNAVANTPCGNPASSMAQLTFDPTFTYYQDADNDGFGNPNVSLVSCAVSPPVGYVLNNTDCDDTRSYVHPGAPELCNFIDDDCDLSVDEGMACHPQLVLGTSLDLSCLKTNTPFTVSVSMQSLNGFEAAGFQAFLHFDPTLYTFTGGTYTAAPFGLAIITPIAATMTGDIDIASGINQLGGQMPSSADALLATLQFTTNGVSSCTPPAPPVVFRNHSRPSRITNSNGQEAPNLSLVVPGDLSIDGVAPVITCPPTATVACPGSTLPADTGTATATDNCTLSPAIAFSDSFVAGCGVTGVITRTWTATDCAGNVSTCIQTINYVDTTAPTFNEPCPRPTISVPLSDAGTCSAANVVITPPTASDTCNSVIVSYTRSDGGLLADPYPAGTTVITWKATDACNNMATCLQNVVVSSNNNAVINIQLQNTVTTPLTRCITFVFYNCNTNASTTVSQMITFTGGVAAGVNVAVPCTNGPYTCVTARDALHTLRRTTAVSVLGLNYTANFANPLLGGNLNDDEYIDILDFGTFAGQYNQSLPASTCSTVAPHSDVDGDGLVFTGDFTFIQTNFLIHRELNCCGLLNDSEGGLASAGPTFRISVADLYAQGRGQLAAGDVNHDGWLDELDVAAFLNGAQPNRLAVFGSNAIGSWFEGSNWGAGAVPDALTEVVIPGTSAVTINHAGAVAATVTLQTGAALRLTSGSLLAQTVTVMSGATLELSGEASLLSVRNLILDAGAIVIWNGGVIEINGGTFHQADINLVVGDTALLSTLRLINGSVALITQDTYIGNSLGDQGRIEIMGSTFTTQTVTVGVEGQGSLAITQRGVVNCTNAIVGDLLGSDGSLLVGAASNLNATNRIEVGNADGFGSLTLEARSLTTAPQIVIGLMGDVAGAGTLKGMVENSGLIAPHGTIYVEGNLTTNGELAIELGKTLQNTLVVRGQATLGGTLHVSLAQGFTPAVGQSFDLIVGREIGQTFQVVNVPQLANGMTMQVVYEPNVVRLVVRSGFSGNTGMGGNNPSSTTATP